MPDEIETGCIVMISFVVLVVLSSFGVLFLVDIGFDTTFENYEAIHYAGLIIGIIIVFLIWCLIFAWYEEKY